MQKVGQIVKSQMRNSSDKLVRASTGELLKTQPDGTKALSLYSDMLTDVGIAKGIKKLQVSFPKQSAEFFNVLAERLIANGFTDKRLSDAVNNIVDNFQYKELNISDVIKFDKKIRLYDHNEYANEATKIGGENFKIFKKINGKNYWAKISDIDKLGL